MNFKFELTLTKKTLLLVLLPPAVQVGLLSTLGSAVKEYNSVVDAEMRTKEIQPALQSIAATLSDCELSAMVGKAKAKRYEADKKLLTEKIDALAALSKGDSGREKRAAEIRKSVESVFEQLDAVAAKDVSIESMSESNADLAESIGSGFDEIDNAITEEIQGRQDFKDLASKAKDKIINCILLSFPINFVVVILLAIFFYQTISGRLRALKANTKKLSLREALNPPLKGSDEIAKLDKCFHQMAQDILQVDQQRRQLLGLVKQGMREPLTAVQQSLAKLNTQELELSDKARQRLTSAEREAEHLVKLVSTLLDIQAIKSGRFELNISRVSAAEVIDNAILAVEDYAASRGVQIRFAPPGLKIAADPGRLTQVIINLLHNAIKYSPQGSTVVVDLVDDGISTEIRVTDEGCGIAAHVQDKIFTRFEGHTLDTDTMASAGGLSLAICKAIIEQHSGVIGVESVENEGSSFWFRIPSAKKTGHETEPRIDSRVR